MRALLLASVLGLASSALAGPIFPWRKAEKVDPKTRVPELIGVLQAEKDEGRRSSAAVELRNFDAGQFPEVVPALVTALLTDTRQGVRIDAAQSLGKIRPVSQAAGEALEHALDKDPSMRVRLQARSVLLGYHWAGYRSVKKPDVPPVATAGTPPPVATAEKRSALGGLFLPPVRTTSATAPAAPARPVAAPPPVA
ncbi:MAG: HEAT repeat domain-containing protein, partial [Gemmataceae bacterium]